jgi:hypothetical protein
MSKVLGKHFAVAMKPRQSKKSFFFEGGSSPSLQEGEDFLAHINIVKALADQLHSIEVNIEDEDMYPCTFHEHSPIF